MEQKLVVKKGYTIEVVSWENDADNYRTKRITVDNKEYALAILDMCKNIFVSCNNGDGGIGNMSDGEGDQASDIIMDYISDNRLVVESLTEQDHITDRVMDINYDLMGSSEYYYSRVFESGTIFYSPEDITVEKIASVTRY